MNKSQDILNAKNNPEALQELTQAEGKAQKADLLEELGGNSGKAKDYSFGEKRAMIQSQKELGFTGREAKQRIRDGEVCFVAGTLVHTKDGEKKIEDIKEGDEVLSYNQQTQAFEYKPVVRTFEKYSDEILSVKITGEREAIGVTPEHPFYVRVQGARSNLEGGDNSDDGEWKAAKNLQVGDEVLQADGSWSTIESVSVRESGAKVYNFEVADNHNYFVGDNGLLFLNFIKTELNQ